MDGRKVAVVEANEVPIRVIEDMAPTGRIPFLAGLLSAGALIETTADDQLSRELYPSQTWASLNSGVAYARHGIYWYGDPKPETFPFYWQLAATAGRSVGLVNTLHSSPLERQCVDGDYRFVLPDCFSADDGTIPARYRSLQRLNISLTRANSRQARLRLGGAELLNLVRCLPTLGLGPATIADIVRLVGGVATGRIPVERLRAGQFLVFQDLFLRLVARESPDLAVLFTNHVAAAMHRYWYALYPTDFADRHYGPTWVDRYRNEVPEALVMLDRFLSRLHRHCLDTGRTLVVVSSMGQGPSPKLCADRRHETVIGDPGRFLDSLGIGADVRVRGSMAPQLTLDCGTSPRAAEVAFALSNAEVGEVFWEVDGPDAVVTLTYRIEAVDGETVKIAGARRRAAHVGIDIYEVDDHSSGRHIPRGILGVANSPSFEPPAELIVDYRHFAPAMLEHLGVPAADHHVSARFSI